MTLMGHAMDHRYHHIDFDFEFTFISTLILKIDLTSYLQLSFNLSLPKIWWHSWATRWTIDIITLTLNSNLLLFWLWFWKLIWLFIYNWVLIWVYFLFVLYFLFNFRFYYLKHQIFTMTLMGHHTPVFRLLSIINELIKLIIWKFVKK